MDTINYSIFLEEVTYDVEVLLNGELISSGSAVAINRDGDLVTAAHNIVRLNHVQEDAKEKGVIIYARSKRSNYFQYRILACAPSIGFAVLREPIVIDLAIIRPIIKNITENYLEIGNILPILGEPVLMAGFSDELELPFNFDKLLDTSNEEIKGQLAKLPYSKRMLMIKSGIIGCINGFEFHNEERRFNFQVQL
jgi:hypothetical protein